MSGRVKRLFDMEIDEISLVDRSANQHAHVAFSKRDDEQESDMPETVIFDAAGDEVFDDELEHGQTYFDEAGNTYLYDETGEYADQYMDDEDGDYAEGYAEDGELAGVGKAAMPKLPGLPEVSRRAHAAPKAVQGRASTEWGRAKRGYTGGRAGGVAGREGSLAGQAGNIAGRYRNPILIGAGATGAAGTAYGSLNKRDSLGASVYEELSKALDQGERDVVISKAMDLVARADRRAQDAMSIAKSLQDERDLGEFIEIAKSYDLPGDPAVLGRVLKNAASVLAPEELDYLDQVLTAAGEMGLYAELGSGGTHQASNIMDEVYAIAGQNVGKFDGVSQEAAVVAMFEANPQAYDEYLSELR